MKPGSPPPPSPDDDAADPLLAALRQRLGDYGHAPPPGAWAAIRRQVAPAALPQPWWRRRHLLAVLGLLFCCLLPGTLSELPSLRLAERGQAAVGQPPHTTSAASPLAEVPGGRGARRLQATAVAGQNIPPKPVAPGSAAPVLKSKPESADSQLRYADKELDEKTVGGSREPAGNTTAGRAKTLRQPPLAGITEPSAQTNAYANATTGTPQRKTIRQALALADSRQPRRYQERPPSHRLAGRRGRAGESEPVGSILVAGRAPGGQLASRARRGQAASLAASAAPDAQRTASDATSRRAARRGAPAWPLAGRSDQMLTPTLLEATASQAAAATAETATAAGARAQAGDSGFFPFGPVGLLALKQPGLLLPAPAALATLAARPDSAPAAPPVRRWALQVLAGPTVSYRTLGPAPVLAARHPDFARLERPALGLGAQVQVRRVLSGRWALAVGLGYHEYATRLALSLKDSAYASVHQRDNYRLLTVPVQLGYAFGVPKSRLSTALLLGAEPGWYLGGRSTEGSGCGCEQQAYSAAAGSPYRPLTVALSLGLDLRYRLGGAGARWQWLVQPTGRYVATPFVRSEAVGFTQRQPFSLGLLTGFSWDMR